MMWLDSKSEPDKQGNQAVLTTDNPNSIHTSGWVRTYKNSRVFVYASGHDHMTYDHASFRQILQNAINWCAGRS